ncbi:helix-turn-helix transcriptional regulator [Nostocoides vanveenii]|uniref:HTH cro/C1-type domain-containing protein n=1 Tax=Nostocoides vanveenii TaxID=330835 RepID=A0ABN2L169_9MICO
MPDDDSIDPADLPSESKLLKDAYRASGLTVAELADATGLSAGTLHVAMRGFRYRDGQPRVAVPPDATLVKLASILRVSSADLRAHGRDRAADLLDEVGSDQPAPVFERDLEAQAAAAGRAALARQVLAAFSTEDLRAELARRESADG